MTFGHFYAFRSRCCDALLPLQKGNSGYTARTWTCVHFRSKNPALPWAGADKGGTPHLSAQASQRNDWQCSTRHACVLCTLPGRYNWVWEASSTMAPSTTCTCVHELQQWLASHTVLRHNVNTTWHYVTLHIDMCPPMVLCHVQHSQYYLCYYII